LVCVLARVPIAKAVRADDVLSEARNVAIGAVRARVRCVTRLRGFEAASLAAREQEISNALAASVRTNQIQPGLFDRRAIRSADESRRADDVIRRQFLEFLARCEQQSVIAAGTPALILATGPSR